MNEAQVEAVITRIPTVLVSAGAGSGKTMVLTERYFHLLDDKVDGRNVRMDDILVLTFTRKAAQEMRQRIARKLEAEGRLYERRELARASIGTIHSFCESLLREYALAVGIDPNFRLLDEAEAGTLQEKALDAVFEALWNHPETEREAIGLLVFEVPHTRLRASLLQIFRHLRTRGMAFDTMRPVPPTDSTTVTTQLFHAIEALLALPGTAKWQENLSVALTSYHAVKQQIMQANGFSWECYYSIQDALKDLTPNGGPKVLAKEARDAIRSAMETWLGAYLDLAALPLQHAFISLIQDLTVHYQRLKDAQGLLDFEDLLLLTQCLLTQTPIDATERLRHKFNQVMVDEFQDTNRLQFSIIEALSAQSQLFMVGDVKQAIYRFIGSDIHVFLEQEQRVIALEEQGIRIPMHTNYRSRAEILEPLNGIFAGIWAWDASVAFTYEPLTAGSDFIPINIPAIEWAFWPKSEGSVAELRDQEAQWISRRILQMTGALGNEAMQVTAAHAPTDETCTGRPVQYGDIILLFRASTDIALYEDALKHAGIPYYTVSGQGFYETREVQDIIYCLRTIENPLDDFALAVTLRSPLVGVTDETLYWLTRDWSAWEEGQPYPAQSPARMPYGHLWAALSSIDTLPVLDSKEKAQLLEFQALVTELQTDIATGQPLDLLDHILQRTHYSEILLAMEGGDQRFANMQKLLEVAGEFQQRGIFDISDFQRYLMQLSKQAPREASAPLDVECSNVVRLMTIHAAKGLEAPVVMLADCGREFLAHHDLFLLSPEGLCCQVHTPEDEWTQPFGYRRAQDEIIAADRQEAERLLYVALTRAREHLICSGFSTFSTPRKAASYADILLQSVDILAPVSEDTDIPLRFEETAYPVRIWSLETLQATLSLSSPPQPATLWDQYARQILSGAPLPHITDATEVAAYTAMNDRLLPRAFTGKGQPLRLGVHTALSYHTCPRQYWFKHVLAADEVADADRYMVEEEHDLPLSDDTRAHSDGTEFGRILHLVMQHIDFNVSLPGQTLPLLQQYVPELSQPSSELPRVEACLQRMMLLPEYVALQQSKKSYRELRFVTRIHDIYVPGIIDLLAQTDAGWVIVDYKTGQPSGAHTRQTAIYALGVYQTLQVAPAKIVLAYLENPHQPFREYEVTPELFSEATQVIVSAAVGVRSKNYRPTPGYHCRYCRYSHACPDGKCYLDAGSSFSA